MLALNRLSRPTRLFARGFLLAFAAFLVSMLAGFLEYTWLPIVAFIPGVAGVVMMLYSVAWKWREYANNREFDEID